MWPIKNLSISENDTHPHNVLCCAVFSGINKLVRLFSVAPESIVIPIVSCIFGFPVLALLVICCLRKRAKLARERDRRRNYDLQDHDHTVSLVRFSPIHRLSEFRCSESFLSPCIVEKWTNESFDQFDQYMNHDMEVQLHNFPFLLSLYVPLFNSYQTSH